MPSFQAAGAQRVTANLAVGTSGVPIIVWRVEAISGTTPTLDLRNGTGTGDNAWVTQMTTTSVSFAPSGVFFPAGCFAQVGGTSPVYVISYTQLATS